MPSGRLPVPIRREIFERSRKGESKDSVKTALNVKRSHVDRWWQDMVSSVDDLKDRPRSGRPRVLNSSECKAIKRAARAGASAVDIAMRRTKAGKTQVSRWTVARVIRGGRCPLFWQREREMRVLRKANREERLSFCSTFRLAPNTSLVFLDGKVLTVYRGQHGNIRYRWAPADAPPVKTKGKLLAHLHLYAAVANGWRSRLYFVPPSPPVGSGMTKSPETFKAEHYVKVMTGLHHELQHHFQNRPYLIIRDRATQHLKAEESGALDHLHLPIVQEYPTQSWDINCIEHVWAQLVFQLRGHRAITADGLRRVVARAWRAIRQSTINSLVANVPLRMHAIIAAEGEWIGSYQSLIFS